MVKSARAAGRTMRAALILALPVLFLLAGCAAKTPTEEEAYLRVLNAWTSGVKVYEGLVDVMNEQGKQSLTAGQMTSAAAGQAQHAL